jgi:hypothetical protein
LYRYNVGEDGMDKYMHAKQVVRYTSAEQFGWYPAFTAPSKL